MSRDDFEVKSAFGARFDARPYSGLDLYEHGGNTYTSPTFAGIGSGLYSDVIKYLNGRASVAGNDLASRIEDAFLSAGVTASVTVLINADDRVEIRCSKHFKIEPGGDFHRLGFDVAGQSATYTGTYFVAIAVAGWDRGALTELELIVSVLPGYVPITFYSGWQQNTPSYIGVSTTADTLDSLEAADYGWMVGDEGHVYFTHVDGLIDSITWVNTGLMRYLGFTGTETRYLAASGGSYIRATYPVRGFIRPERRVSRQTLSSIEESAFKRTKGNGLVGLTRGSFMQHTFDWYLDGPMDCPDDLHQHWLRYVLPLLSEGSPIVVYQDWGDTRSTGRVQDGDEYSTLCTVDSDGYRGRIEGYVASNSGASAANWPNHFRRRAPMKLIVEE